MFSPLFDELAPDYDQSLLWRELERIALEVHQHLLESQFIGADQDLTVLFFEVLELSLDRDLGTLRYVALYIDDLEDSILQVKDREILAELLGVDLGQ